MSLLSLDDHNFRTMVAMTVTFVCCVSLLCFAFSVQVQKAMLVSDIECLNRHDCGVVWWNVSDETVWSDDPDNHEFTDWSEIKRKCRCTMLYVVASHKSK